MIRLPLTFPPPRLHPVPDADAWREFEAANRAAARQYAAFPIAKHNLGHVTACSGCGRNTVARHGWCNKCWRAATR